MCETLVTDLKLTGRVKFFGRLPEDRDVYAIMKSSRVLVIPSIQEGHPLVIPEANACGIPAIGIQGVCDEFISMGDNGYLVNAHKLPLQRTIARALELYPELAQTCRDMATRYDWELITDQVELTYKELL
jgi:glycosyltransferase involved in cell wall biosynthesis